MLKALRENPATVFIITCVLVYVCLRFAKNPNPDFMGGWQALYDMTAKKPYVARPLVSMLSVPFVEWLGWTVRQAFWL